MAVVWSWAFGAEDQTVLAEMGFNSVNGFPAAPTSAAGETYTYPAYPGTKYSWETGGFRWLEYPIQATEITGSVAVAIKALGNWYSNNNTGLINLTTGSGRRIYCYCSNTGLGTISCFVDNVLAGTFAATAGDWHYISITYDVSTVNWTAEFWKDGAQVATGTSTEVAETVVRYSNGSFGNSSGLSAQIIVYDSGTSAADAATPLFVTRVPPNADGPDVGTWVPTGGPATDFAATNSNPFDPTTYTENAAPASGDNVVTQVDNLTVQLGLVAGSVLGATNHTYSIGTAVQAFASCRDSGGAFVDGDTITPDAADVTYCYATATAGLTGTSVIECKYEIV
jgi:hypothetical protein